MTKYKFYSLNMMSVFHQSKRIDPFTNTMLISSSELEYVIQDAYLAGAAAQKQATLGRAKKLQFKADNVYQAEGINNTRNVMLATIEETALEETNEG